MQLINKFSKLSEWRSVIILHAPVKKEDQPFLSFMLFFVRGRKTRKVEEEREKKLVR